MLNIKNMKLSVKILGIVTTIMITCGVLINANDFNVISHDEYWVAPFESVITTEYNLGNGFTAKSITTTVTTIFSAKHSDEKMFSPEQWNAILIGIADGSIVWED